MPTPKTKKTAIKAKPASSKSATPQSRKSKVPAKVNTKAKSATSHSTSTRKKPVATKAPKTEKNTKPVKAKKTVKTTKTTPVKSTKTRSSIKSSAKEAAKSFKKNVEPHALNDEMNEKVRELIHLSREQGFLTYKDIDKSLPEIATQPEELQNVISIFNNLEIKLLDSAEVDKFKKKKEESEEETARSNQSDMLDDPVRMYLKQMGQVPLLSREEEVDIKTD